MLRFGLASAAVSSVVVNVHVNRVLEISGEFFRLLLKESISSND
jgi:hypothetical protein